MKTEPRVLIGLLMILVLTGHFPPGLRARTSYGIASWYGNEAGERTASGERFDKRRPACASWMYPLGSRVRVTNLLNGRSVVCRVNDRGPAWGLGRTVDLTEGAFAKIARLERGLAPVRVDPLSGGMRTKASKLQ